MLRLAGRALRHLGPLGLARIAAAEQHVRRLRQPIAAGRIVAALAAQRLDLLAGVVALRALQIDARMMRRDVARRQRPLRAGD